MITDNYINTVTNTQYIMLSEASVELLLPRKWRTSFKLTRFARLLYWVIHLCTETTLHPQNFGAKPEKAVSFQADSPSRLKSKMEEENSFVGTKDWSFVKDFCCLLIHGLQMLIPRAQLHSCLLSRCFLIQVSCTLSPNPIRCQDSPFLDSTSCLLLWVPLVSSSFP